MTPSRPGLLLPLLVALAPAAHAQTLVYSGTVGKFPVHLVVEPVKPKAAEVRGHYFYASQGRLIEVAGRLDAQAVGLEAAGGAEVFEGKAAGEALSGEWRMKGKALPFALAREKNGLAGYSAQLKCKTLYRAGAPGKGIESDLDLALAKGRVTRLDYTSLDTNYAHSCDTGIEKDTKVQQASDGQVAHVSLVDPGAGPAACAFRIARAGEFLVVTNTDYKGCLCGARMTSGFLQLTLNVKTGRCVSTP